MTGARVVQLVVDQVESLAAEIAAHFDPDEAGRRVETYLAEIRSDLSEAICEAVVKVVDDTPPFDEWKAEWL